MFAKFTTVNEYQGANGNAYIRIAEIVAVYGYDVNLSRPKKKADGMTEYENEDVSGSMIIYKAGSGEAGSLFVREKPDDVYQMIEGRG